MSDIADGMISAPLPRLQDLMEHLDPGGGDAALPAEAGGSACGACVVVQQRAVLVERILATGRLQMVLNQGQQRQLAVKVWIFVADGRRG
eukprot:54780-Chlamydomonas_euryale.AAC.2